ncbi:hypothetical protein [Bremerella sp.]|uniref:hypothetical protein n=1 Tax=Bremerella sp. TaxID=2795602 RepID=UPI00391A5B08
MSLRKLSSIDIERASNWLDVVDRENLVKDAIALVHDLEKELGELFLLTNLQSVTSSYAEIFVRDPSGPLEMVETVSGLYLKSYRGVSILVPLTIHAFVITETSCCLDEGRVISFSPVMLTNVFEECSTKAITQLKEKYSNALIRHGYSEIPLSELSIPFDGSILGEHPFDHDQLRIFDVLFQNIH